ncbi:hypothetical protein [Chitinilyticum aquatile]|uniref:hypothetical protein n=1 Tax=Chitinilyticum aquatile TaxID=362520 RepID=UPI00041E91E9|nr:hypothetical protein [Chitinilyticum aquatile]
MQLEFFDSEVAGVDAGAGALVIRFAAAHVHDADGEAGYLRGLVLTFRQVQHCEGVLTECCGRLRDGSIRLHGFSAGRLDLASPPQGLLHVELQFANGAGLVLAARGLEIASPSDCELTDVFRC